MAGMKPGIETIGVEVCTGPGLNASSFLTFASANRSEGGAEVAMLPGWGLMVTAARGSLVSRLEPPSHTCVSLWDGGGLTGLAVFTPRCGGGCKGSEPWAGVSASSTTTGCCRTADLTPAVSTPLRPTGSLPRLSPNMVTLFLRFPTFGATPLVPSEGGRVSLNMLLRLYPPSFLSSLSWDRSWSSWSPELARGLGPP